MIPLHKLAELPLSQGLRKTAKIFEEAERRLILKGLGTVDKGTIVNSPDPGISQGDLLGLTEILNFWIPRVPPALGEALGSARDTLKQGIPEMPPEPGLRQDAALPKADTIRRALNTVHHLLHRETGQYPADWDFVSSDSEGGLDPEKRQIFPGMEVYLEDIRSPFNVGAMFRTAESFGAERLYLSPFCADPNHPRAKRTAMGCVSVLPWQRLGEEPFGDKGLFSGSFLRQKAFFALETGGTNLKDFRFPRRGVMIAGSEELGVSPHALAAADASLGRVSIPCRGAKGSLNVSVAFGIAMQAWAASLEA